MSKIVRRFRVGTIKPCPTVGASPNIIEASWRALADSLEYALVRLGSEGAGGA